MDHFGIKKLKLFILLILVLIAAFLFLTVCTNWLGEPILTDNTTLISGEVIDISDNASGEFEYYISLSSTENDVVSVIPISTDTKIYTKSGIRFLSADFDEVLQLNTRVKALASSNVIYDDYETLSGEYIHRDIYEFCYTLTVLD